MSDGLIAIIIIGILFLISLLCFCFMCIRDTFRLDYYKQEIDKLNKQLFELEKNNKYLSCRNFELNDQVSNLQIKIIKENKKKK